MTYDSKDIDPILKDTLSVIEQLTAENIKLAEENKALACKAAEVRVEEKVVLEKVATPVFSQEDLTEFTQKLAAFGFLPEEQTKKVAGELHADPSQLLDIAETVMKLSVSVPSTGAAIEKNAYTDTINAESASPWQEVVDHGVR